MHLEVLFAAGAKLSQCALCAFYRTKCSDNQTSRQGRFGVTKILTDTLKPLFEASIVGVRWRQDDPARLQAAR